MSKPIRFCAVLIVAGAAVWSPAQVARSSDHVSNTSVAEWPQEKIADSSTIESQNTGTMEFHRQSARQKQPLLENIVTWLSDNFGLPANHDYPQVELISPTKMSAVRYRESDPDRPPSAVVNGAQSAQAGQDDLEGLYIDASRTIYLRQGWTGNTPAELSVLVHEMVHHLQNVAGLKYECPQAREKLAYEAQDRWLAQFGRSLKNEFEIDAMTVLIHTKCMH